jgi:hypothetical protein
MALTGALCLSLFAVTGITNKSLRACVARLLGEPYTTSHMTYDLRRLRLKGLIQRIEHTHTYTLTPEGQRVAIFYTKLNNRLLQPLLAADKAVPSRNAAKHATDKPLAHPLGTTFNYNTGSTFIIDRAMAMALGGGQALTAFIKAELFTKLGINSDDHRHHPKTIIGYAAESPHQAQQTSREMINKWS